MIKLVLTDLDSTLIWREDHVVSARALAAIRRAQAAGVHVVPCTGRHFRDLTWMFDGDAAACSTAVTSNGQLVYLDGELVERVPLPRAALSGLLDLLAGELAAGLVVEIGEDKTVVGRDLDFVRSHPDTFWGVSSSVPEVPEEPCYKANVRLAGSFARCEELAAELDRACPDLDFLLPMPGTPHIDVMPRGVGKDHGGDFLMERLGLTPEEVCCFGDADNDLALLRHYPHSVAVANAVPSVLAAARWHIGPASEDSVARALEDIAEATAAGRMPPFMA